MGKAQRRRQKQHKQKGKDGQRHQGNPIGFGVQSDLKDPDPNQIRRAIAELAESQQQMFLAEYRKRGRFAALIDTHRRDIPFITLKTLQTPKSEPSIFREITGMSLLHALQAYDPEKEGILLHVWDVLNRDKHEITIKAQIRRVVFGQVMHPMGLPAGSNPRGDNTVAALQAVLLATSEPIGPVLSLDPLEEAEESTAAS